ncbi:MAG: arginine repressor [Acidimicrobiales bacterium]|nr:arginine repressor [Acidimicrobiales bacterium]
MTAVEPARLPKSQRQHLVGKLLSSHQVTSQEHLVSLLAANGCAATQATVSRDLDDLGAIKVRAADGVDSIYAIPELPKDQRAPEDHLRRVLVEWVVEIVPSGNLVVLRTPPGHANVVGAALDRSGWSEVVGTVAGDDTIIVVAAEGTTGRQLASKLQSMAGNAR